MVIGHQKLPGNDASRHISRKCLAPGSRACRPDGSRVGQLRPLHSHYGTVPWSRGRTAAYMSPQAWQHIYLRSDFAYRFSNSGPLNSCAKWDIMDIPAGTAGVSSQWWRHLVAWWDDGQCPAAWWPIPWRSRHAAPSCVTCAMPRSRHALMMRPAAAQTTTVHDRQLAFWMILCTMSHWSG